MNWNLAVEKNLEALRRILVMLVAMVGMTAGGGDSGGGDRANTLPRHLHRFVLRLLRPAEAATRRLIIVAARGLVVKLPKLRASKPKSTPEPKTIYVLDRVNGSIVSVPVVMPEPVNIPVPPQRAKRTSAPAFPLFDPFKSFGARRSYAKPGAMPSIRLLADSDPIVPFFRRPEPAPPPSPPSPSPDDPLDAGRIHRRLEAIGRALEDLPGQAQRMARWQARRDARLAREREAGIAALRDVGPIDPHSVSPFGLATSPPFDGGEEARRRGLAPFLYPGNAGGEVASPKGETEWGDFHLPSFSRQGGVVRGGGTGLHDSGAVGAQPKRRFHRLSPMRPGRPPGWRRKPNHDVYEVLNELHGLAVWASERRDSS